MTVPAPLVSSSPIERAIEEAAWTVVAQTFGERAAASVRFYVPPGLLVREPNAGVEQMATLLGVRSLPLHTRVTRCFRELVGLPTTEGNGSTLGEAVAQARRHYLAHLFETGVPERERGIGADSAFSPAAQ